MADWIFTHVSGLKLSSSPVMTVAVTPSGIRLRNRLTCAVFSGSVSGLATASNRSGVQYRWVALY